MEHITDLLPDMVYIDDLAEQRTCYINQAVTTILGCPADVHALDRPLLYDLLHAEDRPRMDAHRTRLMSSRNGTFLTFECRVRHATAGWRDLAVRERVLTRTAHGIPLQVLGIAQDVTGHRNTEQALRSALERTDTILREMHHRVTNHLQFLSGLFSLQSQGLLNPADQAIFQEAQNRIQAIALAHDSLLPTSERPYVNLGDYLTRILAPLHDPFKRGVALTLTFADEIQVVPMTKAIPCGLIVNELVTNAIKHAFPDDRHGTISVTLGTAQRSVIGLTVSDNGIGLPAHIDLYHSNRRGLRLVQAFTRQLQGDIQIEQHAGTRIRITFLVQ